MEKTAEDMLILEKWIDSSLRALTFHFVEKFNSKYSAIPSITCVQKIQTSLHEQFIQANSYLITEGSEQSKEIKSISLHKTTNCYLCTLLL